MHHEKVSTRPTRKSLPRCYGEAEQARICYGEPAIGGAESALGRRPGPQLVAVSGQGSPGMCDICGQPVEANAAFVDIGPTDWTDPSAPKSRRWVPRGTDVHGWSPFVVEHPKCFVEVNGPEALDSLMASSP